MEPSHPIVIVPIRQGLSGTTSLRVFRRPDGTRSGVAFTSMAALDRAMGPGQEHLVISARALRGMLAGLGVTALQVDPELVAQPAPAERDAS